MTCVEVSTCEEGQSGESKVVVGVFIVGIVPPPSQEGTLIGDKKEAFSFSVRRRLICLFLSTCLF